MLPNKPAPYVQHVIIYKKTLWIKHLLSFHLMMFLITFAPSRLDYCNSLFYWIPQYSVLKLRVSNRASHFWDRYIHWCTTIITQAANKVYHKLFAWLNFSSRNMTAVTPVCVTTFCLPKYPGLQTVLETGLLKHLMQFLEILFLIR